MNACYKAIDEITEIKAELMDFTLQSVTEGNDALGEVTARVKIFGQSVVAQGTSTDIVIASAKAYINAINQVLAYQ